MSGLPPERWGNRPAFLLIAEDWVLRFRLMVKRGHRVNGPLASEGEAQHGAFCRTGRIGQGDQRLHCGRYGQNRAGSKGYERTRRIAGGVDEPSLPLQADRIGSRSVVAVAVQRSCLSWIASDLCRDA